MMSPPQDIARRTRRPRAGAGTARVTTLRHVAAAAGVSIATASRALSHPERVGIEVEARVSRMAADLGYVRNGAAGALSSSRSGLVGVLVPDASDELHAALLASLGDALRQAGFGVVLASDPAIAEFRRVLSAGVEGVVALGAEMSVEALTLARARRLPVVDIASRGSPRESDSELDLARGAATVAGYLGDLGHRRFGLIGAKDSRRLWHGCTRALETALGGLAGASLLEATTPPLDFEAAADRAEQWLRQPTPPTAIVCSDDALAAGVLRGCARAGVEVPAGVSVVGVGDFLWGRHVQPALTSLRLPVDQAGRNAASRLVGYLRESVPEPPAAAVARLVVRGSTGRVVPRR